ncbi:hypothetical protein HNR60_003937 [Rhodopseudomonas rhenobacensis]|uniref:Uncharacterized protein n=1 Tax=Rhodopseudomonas rhenobacensis TaxID=87461 RepID=A0A7W7Z702_9BRAD|nr:hypothetical protein [Rhodopseudomonas rhenobacensis]MBB5049163.1 hypothetical protein [Rhodopseudomonas rhenobacensis]
MPHHIKLLLSLGCLLTAAAAYVYMARTGQTGPSYAVAFLGVFATIAMWVFPEVMKKGDRNRPARS